MFPIGFLSEDNIDSTKISTQTERKTRPFPKPRTQSKAVIRESSSEDDSEDIIVVTKDSLTPSSHDKDIQFPTNDIDTELERSASEIEYTGEDEIIEDTVEDSIEYTVAEDDSVTDVDEDNTHDDELYEDEAKRIPMLKLNQKLKLKLKILIPQTKQILNLEPRK